MKKILLASDLSDSSKRTFDFLVEIGAKIEAEIHILHVQNENFNSSLISDSPGFKTDSFTGMEKALIRLQEWVKEGNEKYKVNNLEYVGVKYFLETGNPVEFITEYANSKDYDLLAITAKGGGKIRQLLGSLAYPLLEEVNIPVFFIPDNNELRLPKELFFSTDFHENDISHLLKLYQLFAQLQINICLSHFSTDDDLESNKNIMDVFILSVQDTFPYQKMTKRIFSREDGRSIIECLKELENGWIALSTHKRGMFEKIINPSISERLLNNLERPLIVFKN